MASPDRKTCSLIPDSIEYFNARLIIRDEWILLSGKLMFTSLAWMDNLKFWKNINIYYRSPTKLREGNVFIGMCHSVPGEYLWFQFS